jgi:Domain of unknown function (DUF5127)/Domain of unknown function (DUF4964)
VPLAVRSPYLSTWLPATVLTSTTAQFWHGETRGFAGLVKIDGKLYSWAGQPLVNGAAVTALTQTSLQVTPTRSIFTSTGGGIQLTAEWLSPIEPGDLQRLSVPFTLLTVSVLATDGATHAVQVYADITAEWAATDESDVINWATSLTSSNRYWSIQLQHTGCASATDNRPGPEQAVHAPSTHARAAVCRTTSGGSQGRVLRIPGDRRAGSLGLT